MFRRLASTKSLLWVAICATLAVGVVEQRSRAIDGGGLEASWREDLHWNITQLQFEILRFMDALQAYQADPGADARTELEKRIDILWSRNNVATSGLLGKRLREVDADGVIDLVGRQLEEYEASLAAVCAGDLPPEIARAVVRDVAAAFRANLAPLQRIAAAAADSEETRLSAAYGAIVASNETGGWIALGSLVITVALVLAALAESRAKTEQLRVQRSLTEAARSAAAARSRFLTMMSHELRTPMNGVMGLLAVMEGPDLDERRRRLISVARRAAADMLGLVEDILELSDLQSGRPEAQPDTVAIGAFADEIAAAIAARLAQPDPGFSARALGAPGAMVTLERRRLVRIVSHLAVFIYERLRLDGVSVTLETSAGKLRVTIVAPDAARAFWDPATLFGPLTRADEVIQTDAIGPALALALIRAIGGAGMMDRRDDGSLAITVTAPLMAQGDAAAGAEGAPLMAAG